MSNAELTDVRKSGIPVYLQKGSFFISLADGAADEVITVPANVLKSDLTIHSAADLEHLLTSLRFWGIVGFITEIVQFVVQNKNLENLGQTICMFEVNFPYLKALRMWLSGDHTDILECAIYCGDIMLLSYLHETGSELTATQLKSAIHYDHLLCVQYLAEHGCVCDTAIFNTACIKGHIKCFEYVLRKHMAYNKDNLRTTTWRVPINATNIDCFIAFFHMDPSPGYNPNISEAMLYNELESIRYGHAKGLPLHYDLYICTLICTKLESFKYLHELGCPWGSRVIDAAVLNGQLEFMKYAHEHGCPWEAENLCTYAATSGNVDCLRYVHEQGCPWSAETTRVAKYNRHQECLDYAIENGCPCEDTSVNTQCSKCVCS